MSNTSRKMRRAGSRAGGPPMPAQAPQTPQMSDAQLEMMAKAQQVEKARAYLELCEALADQLEKLAASTEDETERAALHEGLKEAQARVRGARAYGIAAIKAVIDPMPHNPADPGPQLLVPDKEIITSSAH